MVCGALAFALPAWAQGTEPQDIQKLIKEGRHAQALKMIDDYLVKNPKDANMRFRRGVALSMLDRKNEALAVFQKLVEDHPDMPAPYNNLAVLYGAQGDYEKARGALEKAIRTNPAYATAYQNLGDVYAQLASQAYAKALQLDKNDASVPPKLALLRELASAPGGGGTVVASATTPIATAAAASASTSAKPVQASAPAAPAPTPSPAPAPTSAAAPASTSSAATTVVASAKTATPVSPSASAAVPAPKPAPTASSAASAPAASAASAVVAAVAKPAPKTPADAATVHIADVEAAVRAWAVAWSKRDMEAYFAAYLPDFSGQQGNRRAWEQERRDRIAARKRIKVDITELQVSVNADKAQARFRQSYASDSLDTSSRKTLELVRSASGKWQIKRESVGG